MAPNEMTKLERALSDAAFTNCTIAITHPSQSLLQLIVQASDMPPFTTEIYKSELERARQFFGSSLLIVRSSNPDPRGGRYSTQTRLSLKPPFERVLRIEASYCSSPPADFLLGSPQWWDSELPCLEPALVARCDSKVPRQEQGRLELLEDLYKANPQLQAGE